MHIQQYLSSSDKNVAKLAKEFLEKFTDKGQVQEIPKEVPTTPSQPTFLETLLMLSVFELKVEISNCLHALVNSVMLVRM